PPPGPNPPAGPGPPPGPSPPPGPDPPAGPGPSPCSALLPRSEASPGPEPPLGSRSVHRRSAADTSTAQQARPASYTRSEKPPTSTGPAESGTPRSDAIPPPRRGAGRSTAAIQPAYAEPRIGVAARHRNTHARTGPISHTSMTRRV